MKRKDEKEGKLNGNFEFRHVFSFSRSFFGLQSSRIDADFKQFSLPDSFRSLSPVAVNVCDFLKDGIVLLRAAFFLAVSRHDSVPSQTEAESHQPHQ